MTKEEVAASSAASRWVQTVDYAEYPHLKFQEMFEFGAAVYRDDPDFIKAIQAGADWQSKVNEYKAKQ